MEAEKRVREEGRLGTIEKNGKRTREEGRLGIKKNKGEVEAVQRIREEGRLGTKENKEKWRLCRG